MLTWICTEVLPTSNKLSVSWHAPLLLCNTRGGDASLELAEQFSSAESTLQAIAELIEALPCDARNAWDRLEYGRADIGLRIGSDARQ